MTAHAEPQRRTSAAPVTGARVHPVAPVHADADDARARIRGILRGASPEGEREGVAAPLRAPETTPGEVGVPAVVREVIRSPGQPLDAGTRAFMEARFGHELGSVRVYTGAQAAASASAVGARAYTVGRDIVFGEGRFAPATAEGRRGLAHEIAHVVQQNAPGPRTGSQDAAEVEARAVASAILTAQPAAVRVRVPAMVQRDPLDDEIRRARAMENINNRRAAQVAANLRPEGLSVSAIVRDEMARARPVAVPEIGSGTHLDPRIMPPGSWAAEAQRLVNMQEAVRSGAMQAPESMHYLLAGSRKGDVGGMIQFSGNAPGSLDQSMAHGFGRRAGMYPMGSYPDDLQHFRRGSHSRLAGTLIQLAGPGGGMVPGPFQPRVLGGFATRLMLEIARDRAAAPSIMAMLDLIERQRYGWHGGFISAPGHFGTGGLIPSTLRAPTPASRSMRGVNRLLAGEPIYRPAPLFRPEIPAGAQVAPVQRGYLRTASGMLIDRLAVMRRERSLFGHSSLIWTPPGSVPELSESEVRRWVRHYAGLAGWEWPTPVGEGTSSGAPPSGGHTPEIHTAPIAAPATPAAPHEPSHMAAAEPAGTPKPTLVEPAPVAKPAPITVEPAPVVKPAPITVEPASAAAPKPVVLAPESAPKPIVAEPAALKPVVAGPAPTTPAAPPEPITPTAEPATKPGKLAKITAALKSPAGKTVLGVLGEGAQAGFAVLHYLHARKTGQSRTEALISAGSQYAAGKALMKHGSKSTAGKGGVVDMLINLMNAVLQLAGAPEKLTDVTSTVASVTPSAFVGNLVSTGSRAIYNIGRGDGKAVEKQVREMQEGKAGAPLQGYALVTEVLTNLATGSDIEGAIMKASSIGKDSSMARLGNAIGTASYHFINRDLPDAVDFAKKDLAKLKKKVFGWLGL